MYPHIINCLRASVILATVESSVVTCEPHSALFCLPVTHRPLRLLLFACLHATNIFSSTHTVLAVVSLPLPVAPRTGVDPNMMGGLWIPIPILPQGMKYLYIQGVTGGMCETLGECSLGQTIPI